jgi:hypothetical protein
MNEQQVNQMLRRALGQVGQVISQQRDRIARLEQAVLSRPRTIAEQIDALPGRRIESVFSGEVVFTADDDGQRGEPVTIQVSQDGPFIETHYPLILWRPTAPENATNFGRWRPVSTFPLPDQVVDTDIIDIMYEFSDGGNQRNFQNAPRGLVLSRPDNLVPLPVPTMFASGATIQIFPTYNNLTWDAAVPPTAGTLHVDLIGYRIVNM